MKKITSELLKRSEDLLQQGQVDCMIGWKSGLRYWQSRPVQIRSAQQMNSLGVSPFSSTNLAKYLVDIFRQQEKECEEKVAIWVRGCDARAINRLIADGVVERDRLHIFGFICPGFASKEKVSAHLSEEFDIPSSARWRRNKDTSFVVRMGEREWEFQMEDVLADRCASCTHAEPIIYDEIITDERLKDTPTGERFSALEDFVGADLKDRYEIWRGHMQRCLRCYACRNICPACNCVQCMFDSNLPDDPGWLSKANTVSDKQIYHIMRAFHVAGRCIECGECERVCPVDIPLAAMMQKIAADIDELFGHHEAAMCADEIPPLQDYRLDDPDIEEDAI